MKVEFEFKVNQALENAFRLHLQNTAEGEAGDDRRYTESLIDELDRVEAEKWSKELKSELSVFVMFRAGFQSAAGYKCDDFEA